MLVERLIEGDRNERMRLDRTPMSAAQGRAQGAEARRLARHRRADRRRLGVLLRRRALDPGEDLPRRRRSMEVYFFIGLFTATTYTLAGWAREQVCTYMCPWPRFQAAMLDEQSVIVTYQKWRGEPRGKHKAGESWEGRGDCIDCTPVRRGVPDRHRHPRRPAARMHRLRPVHRCLQPHDGEGRPRRPTSSAGTRSPTSRPRSSGAAGARVAAGAAAHDALRGCCSASSPPSWWRRSCCAPTPSSRSSATAARTSCGCRTATSATPTPSRSSNKSSSAQRFELSLEGLPAADAGLRRRRGRGQRRRQPRCRACRRRRHLPRLRHGARRPALQRDRSRSSSRSATRRPAARLARCRVRRPRPTRRTP